MTFSGLIPQQFAKEKCTQAVMGFLETTDIRRIVGTEKVVDSSEDEESWIQYGNVEIDVVLFNGVGRLRYELFLCQNYRSEDIGKMLCHTRKWVNAK